MSDGKGTKVLAEGIMTGPLAPLAWTIAVLGCGGIAVAVLACIGGWVLRDLWDKGDGQGGIPPLPRDGTTQQLPLGDLVIAPPEWRHAAYMAARPAPDATEVICRGRGLGDLDPDPALGDDW
jgi:hypothetical protein